MELIKIRPKSFGLGQRLLSQLGTRTHLYLYGLDLESVTLDYDLEDTIKHETN